MVYLGDEQLIWVWCKVPMNTALLALETRVDTFLWFGSVYETVYLYEWYLQNVLVYGRTWYIWIVVVIISEYWDWNWTTCMETNEKILICLQAIKNHSDATPSYALMWSYRRGLWRIRRDSNLYLLNFSRPSLRWFFVFLWFPNGVYEIDDFPMLPSGVWVYFYFSVQSKTVSWALVSRIGLRGVFDGTVDGLVA